MWIFLRKIAMSFAAAQLFISVGLASEVLIEKVESPEMVVAGETAIIKIVPSQMVGGDAIYRFGADKRHPFILFKAENAASQPEENATDRRASRSLKGKIPDDGKSYALWVRASGKSCDLRIGKGYGGFNIGTANGVFKWIRLKEAGDIAAGTTWDMNIRKDNVGSIDCAILTTDPNFIPSDSAKQNVFTWRTNPSSIGKHIFTVGIEAGGREENRSMAIDVVAPANTNQVASGQFKALDISKAANIASFPQNDGLRVLGDEFKNHQDMMFEDIRVKIGSNSPAFVGVAKTGGKNIKAEVAQAENMVKEVPAELPEAIDIPLGIKAGALNFIHSVRGNSGQFTDTLFEYIVHYEDGTESVIPVKEGERIAGQLKNDDITKGHKLLSSVIGGSAVNIFSSIWRNPSPEKTIKFLSMRAKARKHICVLLALGAGTADGSILKYTEKVSCEIAATIDFGLVTGKPKAALLSINMPGIFRLSSSTQLFKDQYFDMIGRLAPPMVQNWNACKAEPRAFDSNECDKKMKAGFERLLKVSPDTRIFFKIGGFPDEKIIPEEKWNFAFEWYLSLIKHLRNDLKMPIDYVEIYNEEIVGKSKEARDKRYRFFNALATKLKLENPGLKVGGTAECWPDTGIIDEFMRNCGENTDFISWHLYPTGSPLTPFKKLLDGSDIYAKYSNRIKRIVAERAPGRKIEQFVTEYNMNYSAWKPLDEKPAKGYAAIWLFSVWRNCILTGSLDGMFYWRFTADGSYGVVEKGKPRPAGILLQILNTRLRDCTSFSAVSSDASVECLALETKEERVIAFVNKAETPVSITIEVLNAEMPKAKSPFERPIESYSINGDDLDFTVESFRAPEQTVPMRIVLSPLSLKILFIPKRGN
jgi:hypothetical protein